SQSAHASRFAHFVQLVIYVTSLGVFAKTHRFLSLYMHDCA
ncbi:hypothetical protein HMPREF1579_01387, partial [Gardnerella vaginalis JCP8066]